MRRFLYKMVTAMVPAKVLTILFPNATGLGAFTRKFVDIMDSIAGKPIRMYLREDSMMERLFLKHGLYGQWEKESLRIWATLAKRARTIVDVGANTGVFSLVGQNNNLNARVIAIEPVPINFEVLSMNIAENGFSILARNVALSNMDGTAKMFMLKDRLNYMTSVTGNLYDDFPAIKGESEVVEIEVPIRPFSWVMETCQLDTLDLIKIDVEGHELAVLESMMPSIRLLRPAVLIEIIGDETALRLQKIFDELNYLYVCIDEESKSRVVDRVWDNDRHNFLFCDESTIQYLREMKVIV